MNDAPSAAPKLMNGWVLFVHPLFLDQVEILAKQAEVLKGTTLWAMSKEPPASHGCY